MNDLVVLKDIEHAIAIQRGETDQQVATAKRFPRSSGLFVKEATALICASDETAERSVYALPRGGKSIVGPSIGFAEVIAHTWGNCRAGARVVDEGDEFLTAQGVFHDLERNVAYQQSVQRRIVGSNGQRYNVDMIGVTANAACSIALRNAILKGVPRAVWGPIYDKAIAMIAGTFETLDNRRAAALAAFLKLGVSEEDVLGALSKRSVKDIQTDDIVVLRGMIGALRDGDSTVSQMFQKRVDDRQKAQGVNLAQKAREQREAKNNGNGEAGRADKPADTTAGVAGAEATAEARKTDPVVEEPRADQGGGAGSQEAGASGGHAEADPGSDGATEDGSGEGGTAAVADDAAAGGDAVDGERAGPDVAVAGESDEPSGNERDGGDGDGAGEASETVADGESPLFPAGLSPAGEWDRESLLAFFKVATALAAADKIFKVERVEKSELPNIEPMGEEAVKQFYILTQKRRDQIKKAK